MHLRIRPNKPNLCFGNLTPLFYGKNGGIKGKYTNGLTEANAAYRKNPD